MNALANSIIIILCIIILTAGINIFMSCTKTQTDPPTIEQLKTMSRKELGALPLQDVPPADIVWMLLRRIEELEKGGDQ